MLCEEKTMTVKDLIQTEIENLDEDELEQLYEVIKMVAHWRRHNLEMMLRFGALLEQTKQAGVSLEQVTPVAQRTGVIAKLRRVAIDGPEDLAANHDKYIVDSNGE